MRTYTYNEANLVLESDTPLTSREEILAICKEVDKETPAEEITLFIAQAHIIVCDHLDGYSIPTDRLALVERYLAAHFAAITYPQASFESVGKVQTSYAIKIALNLDQTRYGQQAKLFDPSGQLKKLNDTTVTKRANISWLGQKQEEWEATHAST